MSLKCSLLDLLRPAIEACQCKNNVFGDMAINACENGCLHNFYFNLHFIPWLRLRLAMQDSPFVVFLHAFLTNFNVL